MGVTANRRWVYAPSSSILRARWADLVAEQNPDQKRHLLKATRDRDITSKARQLPGIRRSPKTLATETELDPPLHRVGYRSFDRQWIIADTRVIDFPRVQLWDAEKVSGQLFLIEQHAHPIRSGPGLVFTTLVPDTDHFKGSEGGSVLPMLHPDGSPNVTHNLLTKLNQRLNMTVTVQDLVAYMAAVTAHPAFTERFAQELITPGIRVPLTADSDLFTEAVVLGRELVWAATYGQAYADSGQGRPLGLIAYPDTDERRVRNLTPIGSAVPERITYDSAIQKIHIGEGSFGPVPERVWAYDVGGMNVIRHWFDRRKARPGGRRSSPLDDIHVSQWPIEWIREFNELLTALRRLSEFESDQSNLLDRITNAAMITRTNLESKGVRFPATPKNRQPRYSLHSSKNEQEDTLL